LDHWARLPNPTNVLNAEFFPDVQLNPLHLTAERQLDQPGRNDVAQQICVQLAG
jgi:hypothetical protein